MKMNSYTVKFNGKTYFYRASNGGEALDKFANRKVFGDPIICGYRINSYDADTRGGKWIFASVRGTEQQIEVDLHRTNIS